jgi:hypothetical protein
MKQLFVIATLFICNILFFSACKKTDITEDSGPQVDPKQKQFTFDANRYKFVMLGSDLEIIKTIGTLSAFGETIPVDSFKYCKLPNGITIDSSQITQRIISFNFDGIAGNYPPQYTRSGQIKIQLTNGLQWNDSNAILTLTYSNFKIRFADDGQSISFNGVRQLRTLDTLDWLAVFSGTSVIRYSERGFNISVKNEDNTTASLNITTTTEISFVNTLTQNLSSYKYYFSNLGDSTLNGQSQVDSWGTNRYGYQFVSHHKLPIITNTYHGTSLFNSGSIVQKVNGTNYTIDHGFDSNGNPTITGSGFYKITWLQDSISASNLIRYNF